MSLRAIRSLCTQKSHTARRAASEGGNKQMKRNILLILLVALVGSLLACGPVVSKTTLPPPGPPTPTPTCTSSLPSGMAIGITIKDESATISLSGFPPGGKVRIVIVSASGKDRIVYQPYDTVGKNGTLVLTQSLRTKSVGDIEKVWTVQVISGSIVACNIVTLPK